MAKQQFTQYENKKIRIPVKGDRFVFGVVSDTHLGSKYVQLSFLKWTYQYFKKMGAKFVLHAGDIVDGGRVYRAQEYETYAHGFSQQLDDVVRNYPNNLPTYFCSGNHDLSFYESGGGDICKEVAARRSDMNYLGQLGAFVYFGHLKVYLVHCLGSPPYAISYRGQKLVEAMSTENKPNLMIVGHHHQAYQFFIRNVHVLGGGSFQGQTPFLRRMAIFPVIGGYLCEVLQDRKGIARFRFEFLPCYKPKANDYEE
jgi:predicted phosphodiesterase